MRTATRHAVLAAIGSWESINRPARSMMSILGNMNNHQKELNFASKYNKRGGQNRNKKKARKSGSDYEGGGINHGYLELRRPRLRRSSTSTLRPSIAVIDLVFGLMAQPPIYLHQLPRGHGPPSSYRAPTFVKSVNEYDELGRSVAGDVRSSSIGTDRAKDVASFWRSIEVGTAQPSTTSLSAAGADAASAATTRDRRRSSATTSSTESSTSAPSPPPPTTVRQTMLPKSQWFIRRVLSRNDAPSSSSAAALPPLELPPPPPKSDGSTPACSSSIKSFHPPPYFHLKDDNKGYQVLQRIGWDGRTGLGGPPPAPKPSTASTSTTRRGDRAELSAVDLDAIDDDDDVMLGGSKLDSVEDDNDPDIDDSAADGRRAGRLAPIPTYLKHDLRGIGHKPQRKYSSLRPTTTTTSRAAFARKERRVITHTEHEIRALQRGKVILNEDPEHRVKREKRRAIKAVKRDREERQVWQSIISS